MCTHPGQLGLEADQGVGSAVLEVVGQALFGEIEDVMEQGMVQPGELDTVKLNVVYLHTMAVVDLSEYDSVLGTLAIGVLTGLGVDGSTGSGRSQGTCEHEKSPLIIPF